MAMQPIATAQLHDALTWRYATKRFDPKRRIPDATWQALEEALVLTPSSFGLQPWRFIVITDPALKQQLVPHSWNQTQVAECSHHVVFAAKRQISEADIDHFVAAIAASRNVGVEAIAPYRKMIAGAVNGPLKGIHQEWNTRQAYIALGNFMTSAALLGVDTCPMEGLVPAEYDRVLGLTDYATCVACAAGYRAADDKYATIPKVRFPAAEVVIRR
jgi:nitroreductase